jgi:hypothetical protein
MIEIKCKIKYDPVPLTGKAETMFKEWWMIATVEGELTEYYAWFVLKRTGIILQRPAWGAHISVIRGEEPENKKLWKKYQDSEVTMVYDPDVRTNGEHWWMRAHCPELLDIREELGLVRFGSFNLHLTLGRPLPRHKETSDYFLKNFKLFNPSTTRPMTPEKAMENFSLEPIEAKHKELKRTGDSAFRSECPSCEIGMLMVRRDAISFKLQKDDSCTYCGRRFVYTDLVESVALEYI